VSLIPVTGGIFNVTISYATETTGVLESVLWDRKTDGGFPETKELKNRVRNIVEPGRDLGHIDRSLKKGQSQASENVEPKNTTAEESGVVGEKENSAPDLSESTDKKCEDCV
jgi:Rdx family